MNVLVDSSGWIEFFLDGPKAHFFGEVISNTPKERLLVPVIVLYELFKIIKTKKAEQEANQAIAHVLDCSTVLDLDKKTAIFAANVSIEKKLAMADAIIWAIAELHNAKLKTKDQHFKGMPNVDIY